jgi:hypothetical protein
MTAITPLGLPRGPRRSNPEIVSPLGLGDRINRHQLSNFVEGANSGELVKGSSPQLRTRAHFSASASQYSISFAAATARSRHMTSRT